MRNTLSCVKKCLLSLYIVLYNDNKYFYYTSFCIMRNTLSCIIKYLVSLYKTMYNDTKYFIIHRLV